MPLTANLSSQFDIRITNDAGGSFTVNNPGRSFTIISVSVYDTGVGTAVSIQKNGSATVAALTTPGSAGWYELVITTANADFSNADYLAVAPGNAAITDIIIRCIGNPSSSLTVT